MADMMIPEGWRISKIGDTCHILDSKRIPLNSQERATRQGAYPYYGANGIQGYIDDFIFEGEHVLLAEDGGYFDEWDSRPISYLVNGKFWVNNHAHILRAKKGHETKYVHYSLVHKNILKHINGGTRAKLNQSDMREIAYLTPPLPEQQKIATILTSVDTVIEKTRAQIDKLKYLKTGMMQQLLTQGIGHTEFKDSPVGRIPKAWEVKTLGDLIKSMDGGVSVNGENREKGLNEIGVLKVSSVFKGQFLPQEHKAVIPEDVSRARLNPKKDHILFSRANTPLLVGESAYIDKDYHDLFLPDKLWMIDVKSRAQVNVKWLSYILCSDQVRKDITDTATGSSSTMKNISKPSLLGIQIAVPTILEQQEIVLALQSIDTKITTASHKLISVEQTKKALMQDLLTGKVRTN